MRVLLYVAPALASSFSNTPLSTTLFTPVLCSQTREMLQVRPIALPPCKTYHSLQKVLSAAARYEAAAYKWPLLHLHGEKTKKTRDAGKGGLQPCRAFPRSCQDAENWPAG